MPAEWLGQLPEDIRKEPSLQTVPDIATLAKNYIHSERLIGQNRAPAWDPNWNDQQRAEHYERAGRPASPADYKLPEDIKFEEGVSLDEGKYAELQKLFFEEGFTPRQASAVMRRYTDALNNEVKSSKLKREEELNSTVTKLRDEFGPKYDENIALAQSLVRSSGNPELIKFLDESRLGNHPEFIKFMVKLGKTVSEDTARTGGTPFFMGSADAAKGEIRKLQADMEFQKALQNPSHQNHKGAVERWTGLFSQAFPGKQTYET